MAEGRLASLWAGLDRVHRFALVLGLVTTVAGTGWFFTSSDGAGKTCRLEADAPYYHVYLESMLVDHDLDFTDEYKITGNWYRFGKTPTGRPGNVFGIGPALFELPLFAVGRDIARLGGQVPDGFSGPEVAAAMLASLLATLGALLFAYRLLRRRFGADHLAAVVPLLLACGGPVVYYAIRQPGYAHPFATFWVAWFVDAWDASFGAAGQHAAKPRRLRVWLGLGALLGAATLARPQTVLWGVLLVAAAADDLRRAVAPGPAAGASGGGGPRRAVGVRGLGRALAESAPRWVAGAGVALLCFLPQLIAWHQIYGSFWLVPQGPGFMRWDSPAWREVLFSSRNGLLPWAPLYALAALGLLVAVWRSPRLGLGVVIGIALQVVANGAVWDWWAGGSFGGRRFDSCFIGFAVGLGALLVLPAGRTAGRARRAARLGWQAAVGGLALLLALGNLVLTSQYSGPSVRIKGGQAAHNVIRQHLHGPLGGLVARASHLSNWPARAWFGHRYHTDGDSYDYVVGTFELGERYPGLNATHGKIVDHLVLAKHPRRLIGLDRGARRGTRALRDQHATILVGLNRFGPVDFVLHAAAPPGERPVEVVLRLNGSDIGRGRVGRHLGRVIGTAREVERGVNQLEIEAPPGTVLYGLELDARHNPKGTRDRQ